MYALVSRDCRCAVELYVRRELAEAELAAALHDEPGWHDLLSIVPIEIRGRRAPPSRS